MKIKQDQLTYTITNGREETVFIKGVDGEVEKMLLHILYTLGINTDNVKIVLGANEAGFRL